MLSLSAALKTLHIPLRPVSACVSTLATERDRLPGGRIMHRLLLTYKLKLLEGGLVKAVLQPLQKSVYDGALEGQVFAVYDVNKKRMAFGDVYPESVSLAQGAFFWSCD
jgi:hypothetical protein